MEFVKVPNLPQAEVKLAVVDGRIEKALESGFQELGIAIIKTLPHAGVHGAIAYHPDIMLHHLGDDCIVYAPGTDKSLLTLLCSYGFTLLEGSLHLSPHYPHDIAYNVARIGNMAFCNTQYTDPVLKGELLKRDVQLVHVNQGYAKCSLSIVDGSSVITSDAGIAKAASEHGLEVLQIEPDLHIMLPGLSYGFIGGCSGLLGGDRWAVTGEMCTLDAAKDIEEYLQKKGVCSISLNRGDIIDIGSILPLCCE